MVVRLAMSCVLMVGLVLSTVASGGGATPGLAAQTQQRTVRSSQTASSTQQLVEQADAFLTGLTTAAQFRGAVLIARQGTILLSKGYGLADSAHRIPNTPQTEFRIASLTKQFTAMAILILQEEGKLRVQDHICLYVAPCPHAWQAITIHMLLNHTSGIPNYMGFPDFVSTWKTPATPTQLLARFEHKPLDFAPGTQWNYSSSGYAVLGYIIQQLSGETYQQFVRTHIIEPLQLLHTGYDQNDPPLPQHATGYANWVDKASPTDVSVFYAAAGLYSSVEDLYLWDQALYTDKLVSRKTLRAMFTPSACVSDCGSPSAVDYGYGWFIGQQSHHPLQFHGGLVPGFPSYIMRYPQDKLTIVILSNLETAPVDPTVAQGLEHLVFAHH